jgi:uncharacterized protein (UPF0332 family)
VNRIQQLLNLAREELETAELLLENHRYRACASRSYYVMYYAAQALLVSKLINSKTHKGVIQLFGQHFVKTGELSIDYAKSLGDAYDLRRLSDYDETFMLTHSQAEAVVESARTFLQRARALLQSE